MARNVNYPALEDVEMMGIMEMRKTYRFLPVPETQEECDILNRLAARIQENGMMTLPIRVDSGLDFPDTTGHNSESFRGS